MKKTLILIFILLSLKIYAQNDEKYLAITNSKYLDVHEEKYIENVTILIKGDKIQTIGMNIEIPENSIVLDASGKFILPGLIDSHVHFFQSGGLYTRPDVLDLREIRPYEDERKWLLENFDDFMKRYLRMGITAVFDVGGPFTNYKLRERSKLNPVFPSLYVTGPLISTYQPKAFQIEDPPIIKVENEEEARKQVRNQLPHNPDFIKIWYIHLPELPADSTYNIVKATIEESHKNNLPVAVHATELHTAKLAIKAGADFLVHGVDDQIVDKEFTDLLLNNDVTLIPTLLVMDRYNEVFSQKVQLTNDDFTFGNEYVLATFYDAKHLDSHRDLFDRVRNNTIKNTNYFLKIDSILIANLRILSEKNVKIATGTDAGNIGTLHASSFFHELQLMKKSGMTNAQILKASTITPAQILNLDDRIGSIEEGKYADLIVSGMDPLADLSFAKSIEFVVKNGYLMKSDTIINETPVSLVQKQVNGYNARNIDAFLEPYAQDVELYNFPDSLISKGIDKMREDYIDFFERVPELHCEVKNRITYGNIVIDHESISGFGDNKVDAVAIYYIENNKISKVYFIIK